MAPARLEAAGEGDLPSAGVDITDRSDRRPGTGRRAVAVSGVVTAVFSAWIALEVGGPGVVQVFDDLAFLLIAAAAGWVTVRASRRTTGELRRSWQLMAAAHLSFAAGQVVWCWHDLGLGRQPNSPSFADVGYLLSVALVAAAVLAYPVGGRSAASRVRRLVDGMIVAG